MECERCKCDCLEEYFYYELKLCTFCKEELYDNDPLKK